MKPHVLDASALLALLHQEPGWETVRDLLLLENHVISSVNVAEVVGKAREGGIPQAEAEALLASLNLDVRAFDTAQALIAGDLRPATRAAGLSLGDRACLALAVSLGGTAVTADRAWKAVPELPVPILNIRPSA
jgi:PIN domain nuclease of toxin-antitoxin system